MDGWLAAHPEHPAIPHAETGAGDAEAVPPDASEQVVAAVAEADQAVLDAQGGGQIKDLAAIQRGGQLQKLFTNLKYIVIDELHIYRGIFG